MRVLRTTFETLVVFAAVAACDSGTSPVDGPRLPDETKIINGQPSWSPDGTRIVYLHVAQSADEWSRGTRQLWLFSFETGANEYVVPGHSPDWSPSGDRVVFVNGSTLWILDLGSRETSQLTTFADAYQPRWSPDGTSIVFLRWADSDRLWTIAPDGGALRDLGVRSYTADWHPDGAKLVLNSANESQLLTWDINEEGSEPTLLVDVAHGLSRADGASVGSSAARPRPAAGGIRRSLQQCEGGETGSGLLRKADSSSLRIE